MPRMTEEEAFGSALFLIPENLCLINPCDISSQSRKSFRKMLVSALFMGKVKRGDLRNEENM